MKKLLFLTGLVVSLINVAEAQIRCYRAQKKDAAGLLDIYNFIEQKDHEGKQNLLLFPKEVRKQKVEIDIKKERIYVAFDTKQECIIGFIKMFVITDKEELQDILGNELCCKAEAKPMFNGSYSIPENQLNNFKFVLERDDNIALEEEVVSELCNASKGTYLYFGGAYTLPNYRNNGLNTCLVNYAFTDLKNDIPTSIPLVLLYGQVVANTGQKHMVRAFAKFVHEHMNVEQCVRLFHTAYKACKPELYFDNELSFEQRTFETMKVCFPEENKGQGNMLSFMGDK